MSGMRENPESWKLGFIAPRLGYLTQQFRDFVIDDEELAIYVSMLHRYGHLFPQYDPVAPQLELVRRQLGGAAYPGWSKN